VYDPDPGVPPGDDYTAVLRSDGHITGYDLHFKNQPISAAKAQVMEAEVPHDSRQLWFAVKDTCAQMMIQSRTLGSLLGTKSIGDQQGTVMVEFGSGPNDDSYDRSSVNDALFLLLPKTSAAGAPAC
jgi:hypothetical protein